MTKIIAVCSPDRRTGKTTTAIYLGYNLERDGKRVLMVGLDSQGNMTAGLGYRDYNMLNEIDLTIASALNKYIRQEVFDPRECIVKCTEGIDLIPANIDLFDLGTLLFAVMQKELVLRKYLSLISSGYDYIIIDCPPALDIITINALTAADELIIPMGVARFSIKALHHLLRMYKSIRQDNLNPRLRLKGVLLTMVRGGDSYTASRVAVIKDICREANLPVFDTCIPFSRYYGQYADLGTSIYVLEGAEKDYKSAYENLFKEVKNNE